MGEKYEGFRILVVSNQCFAQNSPSGRILGCLFNKVSPDNVAQYYIIEGSNDFNVCSNFYKFTDKDALRSIFRRVCRGNIVERTDVINNVDTISPMKKRYGVSAFTTLMRHFIWKLSNWHNKKMLSWINDFNPQAILFVCGSAPFMYDIAYRISKDRKIPLILFNTEYYLFEKESWFPEKKQSISFNIYKNILKKAATKAFNHSSLSIYNSEWLMQQYKSCFNVRSAVIYQSSDFRIKPLHHEHKTPRITYIGGFAYGRCYPLAQIAETLYSIDNQYRLEVYGLITDEVTGNVFNNTKGLDYRGVIPYDKAKEVISDSDILVLAENPDEQYAKSTNYGFSTKITDYLFSGVPVFAYGSPDNVGISYLKETDSACVAFSKDDIKTKFEMLLTNKDYCNNIVKNATACASMNHDANRNSEKFINIVKEVID